jgi:L-aminopeptidase/D-esterase-like protein
LNNNLIRARNLGIPFDGTPGPLNAITDVAGVEVGHCTIIEGDGPLRVGHGPVRTGVTAVLPRGKTYDPVFAGSYSLNGNGEMTGTIWIEESGFMEGPFLITNTHSIGVTRDTAIRWMLDRHQGDPIRPGVMWFNPVVAETYDGALNDVNGFHVKPEHVITALNSASGGPVAEGNVGGGTGMMNYEFKGGIGTASRRLSEPDGGYTVGVLVQSNFGLRQQLVIAGVPVGRELADIPSPRDQTPAIETGSIIVAVATDAPLLAHQLKRLARRVPMGLARIGSIGGNFSGDIFVAFSTANPGAAKRSGLIDLKMLPNDLMNPLFTATIEATEEAVLNAMVAAEAMTGIGGVTAHRLPHDRVREILKRYNRLTE